MMEFTKEFIKSKKRIAYSVLNGGQAIGLEKPLAVNLFDALDEIERQAARIEELEAELDLHQINRRLLNRDLGFARERIAELEIKQHIHWDADMMLTMADNSKGYIDLIIELQTRLKEMEKELNCYQEKRNENKYS